MNFYTALPLIFLKFWFLEAPVRMFRFILSFNKALFNILSISLMIKTFFKPWKNEYRKGLVGFQRGMGMFIKGSFLLSYIFILGFVFLAEVVLFFGIWFLPVISFWLLIP